MSSESTATVHCDLQGMPWSWHLLDPRRIESFLHNLVHLRGTCTLVVRA